MTPCLCAAIMACRPHPELGYRSCLGILRLEGKYGPARLEAACARALAIGATSYRSVRSILEAGLDGVEKITSIAPPTLSHANVRGASYYD